MKWRATQPSVSRALKMFILLDPVAPLLGSKRWYQEAIKKNKSEKTVVFFKKVQRDND